MQTVKASAHANANIIVTLEQAQKIISVYRGDASVVVSSFQEVNLKDRSYSATPMIKSYRIAIDLPSSVTPPVSFMLLVSPSTTSAYEFHTNSIPTIAYLYDLITSQSSIPFPTVHKLDTSLTFLPYHYLLLSSPPPESITLALARKSDLLTPESNARIDLQLGTYLRQLHSIQNDWFGVPLAASKEPVDPSYSWQESFTLFLETVLIDLESRPVSEFGMNIPFEDIRRYLSRAIGFFLFDDVEVPSLVGFTVSNEDILITLPSGSESDEARITSFPLPTHALWADPMIETLFIPPGPSKTLLEAYKDGGGSLIVFPRQQTKRLWYTLFLAGVVLMEGSMVEWKVKWAMETMQECVEKLKDAPCY